MPVISLEGGNSTDGTNIDPGGAQEVQVTFANPNLVGRAAWIWDNWDSSSEANNLTNPGGASLDGYGQAVAGYIAHH